MGNVHGSFESPIKEEWHSYYPMSRHRHTPAKLCPWVMPSPPSVPCRFTGVASCWAGYFINTLNYRCLACVFIPWVSVSSIRGFELLTVNWLSITVIGCPWLTFSLQLICERSDYGGVTKCGCVCLCKIVQWPQGSRVISANWLLEMSSQMLILSYSS